MTRHSTHTQGNPCTQATQRHHIGSPPTVTCRRKAQHTLPTQPHGMRNIPCPHSHTACATYPAHTATRHAQPHGMHSHTACTATRHAQPHGMHSHTACTTHPAHTATRHAQPHGIHSPMVLCGTGARSGGRATYVCPHRLGLPRVRTPAAAARATAATSARVLPGFQVAGAYNREVGGCVCVCTVRGSTGQ